MDNFFLIATKLVTVSGFLCFLWCVLLRKTKWIFFFVPAAFSLSSLLQVQTLIEKFSLNFGAHWVDYLIVFSVILIVPKNKHLHLDRKILIALFIFISFAVIVSMIASIDKGRSMGRAITFLLVFTIGIYSIPSIGNINKYTGSNKQNIHYFISGIVFWSMMSPLLFSLAYGPRSIQGELGSAYFMMGDLRIDRLHGMGVNATGLGNSVGIVVMYSIIGYIMSKSTQKRVFFVCLLLCSLVILFLSQSRSAVIAVIVSLLLWSILEGLKTNNRGKIIATLGATIILGLCFQGYVWQFAGRGGNIYYSVYDILYDARLKYWIEMVNHAGNTLFYGFGLGNDRGWWSYLKGDNSYLIIMVQVGVIGLFLYLILLFTVVYNGYCWDKKAILNEDPFLPIFPFMTYMLIAGMFGDCLGVPNISICYFLALGILAKVPEVKCVWPIDLMKVVDEKKQIKKNSNFVQS